MRSVLVAAAAAAVTLSGASTAEPFSDYSVKETRRIAYDFAKCVVGRHAAAASEALLRNVDNRTLMKDYGVLIDGDCLTRTTHASAKMSFTGDLYRYALADALVAREFAAAPALDLSKVPPIERGAPPVQPAPLPANASKKDKAAYEKALKSFNDAQSFRILSEFGECVVRTNPAGSKALLLTEPESAAENGSFGALGQAFGECLPEGVTLSFGKLVLRGTIAVNYYRLAHAARPGA
jgi:hypothetical protein